MDRRKKLADQIRKLADQIENCDLSTKIYDNNESAIWDEHEKLGYEIANYVDKQTNPRCSKYQHSITTYLPLRMNKTLFNVLTARAIDVVGNHKVGVYLTELYRKDLHQQGLLRRQDQMNFPVISNCDAYIEKYSKENEQFFLD